MKKTVVIDEDIRNRAETLARQRGVGFDTVVNEALRAGLQKIAEPPVARPYRTESHPMGLHAGYNLDNIQELLSRIEGEATR